MLKFWFGSGCCLMKQSFAAHVFHMPAIYKRVGYNDNKHHLGQIGFTDLKDLMPITFSSPRAQPEVVYVLISNENPYFSNSKSESSASNSLSFGVITKSVKLNGIPENNFLCIFIIASSPGVHAFFCLWRVNKKLPQGETSQNAFQGSRSIN